MAAPLPHHEPDHETPAPPRLALVPHDDADAFADAHDSGIGGPIAVGAAAGCLGVGSLVALASVVGGMEPGAALGFGAFVGSWSGVGLGAMVGGIIGASHQLAADRSA